MRVRAIDEDDAADILRICEDHNLPRTWTWPPGMYGLAADSGGRVVAFAALGESPYGLVIHELFELLNPLGYRGLALLRREIERLGQGLADRRGRPIQVGGIVRVDRESHKQALTRRGYSVEAEVLAKVFSPRKES